MLEQSTGSLLPRLSMARIALVTRIKSGTKIAEPRVAAGMPDCDQWARGQTVGVLHSSLYMYLDAHQKQARSISLLACD